MEDRTKAVIEMIELTEWFESVGQSVSKNVAQVSSWSMAFELCEDEEWDVTQMRTRNELWVALHRSNNDTWDDKHGEIGSFTGPLVRQKVGHFFQKAQIQLPKSFTTSVLWDITNIAMSAEFAHIFTPTFYADLAYWYVKGHFPCGWEGDYPQGRLIIY